MSPLLPRIITSNWQYVSSDNITGTTAVEAVEAKTGFRHYVTAVQVANSDTDPGTYVHILSGSTVIWTGFVSPYVVAAPYASYIEAVFPSPLQGGLSEAINVKVETAAQIRFNVQGFTSQVDLPLSAEDVPAEEPEFDPLSLAPTGFWIPEPEFLFEEEDGTGAVTATDAVGYMADQGTGGDHLVQATAADRPTYQTSGGLHWLESATNDFLANTRSISQPWDRVSAWRILTLADATDLIGGGAEGNFGALYVGGGATELRMYAGSELTGLATPAQDVDFVVVERWNGASSRIKVDNGSYNTGDPGAGNPTAMHLFSGTGSQFIVARCYGIFERAGATLTDDEIAQLVTYFAARQGRVL